jgi:hypothetical protein
MKDDIARGTARVVWALLLIEGSMWQEVDYALLIAVTRDPTWQAGPKRG